MSETRYARPADVRVGDRIRWAGHDVAVRSVRFGRPRFSHGEGIGRDAYLTLDTPVGERVCHWHAAERVQVIGAADEEEQ